MKSVRIIRADLEMSLRSLSHSVYFRKAKEAVDLQREYSPYPRIKKLLEEAPKVIPVSMILSVYVTGSIRVGKDMKRIEEGIKRISEAYYFEQREFCELGKLNPDKKFRKDGITPITAHHTRVALIGAYLGAGSHQIAGLLLHDCPEDCGTSIKLIRQKFGNRVATFVALLTKPKLSIEPGKNGTEKKEWVLLVNEERRWRLMKDMYRPEHYEERLRIHLSEILNTVNKVATPEIKVKAHLYKLGADGLDNLVSDTHLEPYKARIRCTVILSEMRHLEITAPKFREIFLELLRDRGFDIDDTKMPRPIPETKVVESLPLDKRFTSFILDQTPAPNGHITVYIDDEMKRSISHKTFKGQIRVELPHDAPKNSHELLQTFLLEKGISLRCQLGESLLPWASEVAGRIIMVRGLNSMEKYQNFLKFLEEFHSKI